MFYVDTSVLVSYYCPEPLSETAESFLTANHPLSTSLLGEVEFFSAVSRKVRRRELNHNPAKRILAKFLAHVNGGFYATLQVESQHFRLARDWMGQFHTNLKTLDALHLAVASLEELTLVTADRNLFGAAKDLGLPAVFLKPEA
jgi:uncharacterized protein